MCITKINLHKFTYSNLQYIDYDLIFTEGLRVEMYVGEKPN